MCYIHTTEFGLKQEGKILKHTATWRNLRNTMLNETSQSQKAEQCIIILIPEKNSEREKIEWWAPGTREREKLGVII